MSIEPVGLLGRRGPRLHLRSTEGTRTLCGMRIPDGAELVAEGEPCSRCHRRREQLEAASKLDRFFG